MKSYIRFLTRNKLYTAIMVVGLSVAFAFIIPYFKRRTVSLLCGLFIVGRCYYDRYFEERYNA